MTIINWPWEPWPDVPWSYSALSKAEECLLQYGEVNFKKHYPFESSPQMQAGTVTHRQLEEYVSAEKPLPPMLQRIGKIIDRLTTESVAIYPERSLNVTNDFQITTSYREGRLYIKIDLTVILPNNDAIILDYKTSSAPRETDEQLKLAAFTLLLERPEIKQVFPAYIYTKHKDRWIDVFTRDHMEPLVEEYRPRLQRLLDARNNDDFPATPGDHCRWCPVVVCQHNPKYKARLRA